jgi:hypothetical protein
MKFKRVLLVCHALYIFITAVWPLVHVDSFMQVTGRKHDVWLVKTIGALLVPVSLSMFSYLRLKSFDLPLLLLGGGTAIAFILIDTYYVFNDVISPIYLEDAALESIFLVGWLLAVKREGLVREVRQNS